jgi:ElaB/YqjD/DUF883 family membrane-anchored ribosome-binding protein
VNRIEPGDEKGQQVMTQSMLQQAGEKLEQAGEKAVEAAQNVSRVASSVKDALEDSFEAARRVARQSSFAAEEFLDDTKRRVKRHPIETVAATLAVGMVAGALIGWTLKRRQS